MLGLGEIEEEIIETLEDLRKHDVDFVTIGQYLRPIKFHHDVVEYVSDEKFNYYKKIVQDMGF